MLPTKNSHVGQQVAKNPKKIFQTPRSPKMYSSKFLYINPYKHYNMRPNKHPNVNHKLKHPNLKHSNPIPMISHLLISSGEILDLFLPSNFPSTKTSQASDKKWE